MGEVFGTLPVSVAVMLTLARSTLEFLGHHLGDLVIQPLPHLGAAVVQHGSNRP